MLATLITLYNNNAAVILSILQPANLIQGCRYCRDYFELAGDSHFSAATSVTKHCHLRRPLANDRLPCPSDLNASSSARNITLSYRIVRTYVRTPVPTPIKNNRGSTMTIAQCLGIGINHSLTTVNGPKQFNAPTLREISPKHFH